MKTGVLILLGLVLSGCEAANRTADSRTSEGASAPPLAGAEAPTEDGFAELQERGREAMGVDQYTSTHIIDSEEDGGRIELQRDVEDPAGVSTIRAHLQEITRSFEAGDFRIPGFVHAQAVPGTDVMAARAEHISYVYSDLPRGGQVRITTEDPEALAAIHEFLAFQREDHRAAGHAH